MHTACKNKHTKTRQVHRQDVTNAHAHTHRYMVHSIPNCWPMLQPGSHLRIHVAGHVTLYRPILTAIRHGQLLSIMLIRQVHQTTAETVAWKAKEGNSHYIIDFLKGLEGTISTQVKEAQKKEKNSVENL